MKIPGLGYYTPKTSLIYPRLIKNIILYSEPEKSNKNKRAYIERDTPNIDTIIKKKANFFDFSKQLARN